MHVLHVRCGGPGIVDVLLLMVPSNNKLNTYSTQMRPESET